MNQTDPNETGMWPAVVGGQGRDGDEVVLSASVLWLALVGCALIAMVAVLC